jgi:hypothetical protein
MVESIVKGRIMGIESLEEFYAVASDHCKYCPIKLDCPTLDKAKEKAVALNRIKKGPIMNAQEAQEVAEMVLVMEEALKVLKGNLQAFNKEIGPVVVNGREYGYKPSHGWAVKKGKEKDLFSYLESASLDPLSSGIFKLDVRTLQKVGRQATKQFNEKVKEEFLDPTVTTRYGSRKV